MWSVAKQLKFIMVFFQCIRLEHGPLSTIVGWPPWLAFNAHQVVSVPKALTAYNDIHGYMVVAKHPSFVILFFDALATSWVLNCSELVQPKFGREEKKKFFLISCFLQDSWQYGLRFVGVLTVTEMWFVAKQPKVVIVYLNSSAITRYMVARFLKLSENHTLRINKSLLGVLPVIGLTHFLKW